MWKSIRPKSTNEFDQSAARIQHLAGENERMLAELGAMQGRFRSLARSVWQVQEDERRRLARELHDGVGQSLTALRHLLERLPPGTDRDQCSELLVQILEDVRELSRLLRPPILDDLGLGPALVWLARRIRESSELSVEVDCPELDPSRLSPELSTLVFRLAQEALHNVVRHALASRVCIRVRQAGNRLEIEIRDDGKGFDPEKLKLDPDRRGVGIVGMRDRVRLLGGDFSLRSSPGRGTTIQAGLSTGDEPT